MFRALSAHLQEDTVVHMQRMVLSLYESSWWPDGTQLEWELTGGGRLLVCVLKHPPTTFPLQSVLTQAVYRQATKNSHRDWQYHTLHVYNCILLKMSTWGSKHVEENSILWINNNQGINLVIKYIVNLWCTVGKTSRYGRQFSHIGCGRTMEWFQLHNGTTFINYVYKFYFYLNIFH